MAVPAPHDNRGRLPAFEGAGIHGAFPQSSRAVRQSFALQVKHPKLRRNFIMKRVLVCAGLFLAAIAVFAQGNPASPPEKVSAEIGGKAVTIVYSAPSVKGRQGHIFTKDGLISHNPNYPVWRAGANGATTLTTEGDLQIGSVTVPKGSYSLFVNIADPDNWVLIINKKTGESGLDYDANADLGKVK